MARNDVYLNINALSPADAVVTGQQDMTAATVPELVLGDTPTFNFYFTDNTNVWPSWAGNASYTLTWALSDAVAGDFAPAATTGNATPITGGWSVILPLNSYDLVGLLNTKRVGQPYPVQNLWQQLRVTDPSGNEVTRAMFWTPVRYRAISDTQNTESASPTGGRFVTVNNVNTLTTPTAAQFYAANPVPTSALGTAANGELLIGNGTGFTKSTLTAGTGVSITNGSGSITIDASGAQETLTATVKNAESVAITKGQVVYLFGATGGFASVKLAYNTSDATSAKTFGVVSSTSIAANGTGTVTCVGVVDGLNLGAYNDGDTLYLGATPGSVTATKPYAPNHLVYVGIVERANNGNGELYVRVQNGYELDEIHDVQINAPKLAGQTLIYDQTNDLWKNARLTGTANQITVTNADAAVTLSIPTNPTLPGNLTVSGTGTSTFGGNLTVSGTGAFGSEVSANQASNPVFRLKEGGTAIASLQTYLGDLYIGIDGATNKDIIFRRNSGTETLRIAGSNGLVTVAGNLTVSGTGQSSVGGYLSINSALAGSTYGRLISGTTTAGLPAFFATNAVNASLVIDFPSSFVARIKTNSASEVLAFGIGATERARFETTGNLLIGTTTDGGQKLQVSGTAYVSGDATFAGTVTTAYLNSTGGSAFNQFGSGTRTKNALSGASGEVAFDNGTVDSPGVHFYTGNNANYGIDATASSGLRIIKNLDEAGGTVVTSFTDTAATFAVPISSVATGRNTFGGTLAVTGVSAGNATSTGILDFSSGATRLISFGANASTRGTLSVIGLSSDSSLNTTLLTVSSASAVFSGTISPQQATTAGAPAYVKGAIYFDTTLNKLRVGGATGWETITSA